MGIKSIGSYVRSDSQNATTHETKPRQIDDKGLKNLDFVQIYEYKDRRPSPDMQVIIVDFHMPNARLIAPSHQEGAPPHKTLTHVLRPAKHVSTT